MKFEQGDIGARLLESITKGLYDGNLNCIREYVQNSMDSKATKIDIYFENGDENFVIKDDATGMTKDGLKKALRLGWSSKTDEDVGWRGIGIWSGVSVCKKMVIITKAQHNKKYRIEIDCDRLRHEIETNKEDILDVLTAITGDIETEDLRDDQELADSHYTMIRLEKILPQLRTVFEKDDIRKFLENTIPAPFNEGFSHGKKIEEYLSKNGVNLPQTETFFHNEKIFRPPRKTIPSFDDFTPKKFVIKGESIAVAWFITSNNNKIIPDETGGIVFKKKGFTIGDTNLVIKQREKHFYNKWQVGEIHIISKNIRENSPRNNFESAENLEGFLKEVGNFIDQLDSQNKYQSATVVTSIVEKAQKLADSGQTDLAEEELEKAKKKLKKSRAFPLEPALATMKKQIDAQSKTDREHIKELTRQINNAKKDENATKSTTAKERFNLMKKGFTPELQSYEKKFSSHGKLDFDISITRPTIELLQKATGLTSNEMKELCMEAYGWSAVNPSTKNPKLTVDPQLNDKSTTQKEMKYAKLRNVCFGVMIYAVHDLMVNLKKHKQGHPSLAWFENASVDEQYQMTSEIYATIDLINRLIKKSEPYQP